MMPPSRALADACRIGNHDPIATTGKPTMPSPHRHRIATLALFGAALAVPGATQAQPAPLVPATMPAEAPAPIPPVLAGQTYADLVDLALTSPVVVRATVHRQVRLKPEEAPGVMPGMVRLYIEADTGALLVGPDLGASLRFLADVPLTADGKVPKLNKQQVLLFGNVVPGKPGDLLLTASDTMFAWDAALETRTRQILTALVDPDAPPRITALREALHVPGNLVGEGETQFFFATDSGKPVSISVVRRPGEPVRWGVSFSEIVDQSATPPAPMTLAWYRLACALPPAIPDKAAISNTAADRRIAADDYALVLHDLGPCLRNRHPR